jgi:hypothetical protein
VTEDDHGPPLFLVTVERRAIIQPVNFPAPYFPLLFHRGIFLLGSKTGLACQLPCIGFRNRLGSANRRRYTVVNVSFLVGVFTRTHVTAKLLTLCPPTEVCEFDTG